MHPETHLWRPQRTRAYVSNMLENPWARDGSLAREQRAWLSTVWTSASRQEELEDFDVAPPRPTRSYCPRVGDDFDWFDAALFAELEALEGERLTTEQAEQARDVVRAAQEDGRRRRQERDARLRARAEQKRAPWRVTLENGTNWDRLQEFESRVYRLEGGHWHVEAYYRDLDLVDTKGFSRRLTYRQAAWVLQHGDVRKEQRLRQTCRYSGCVSPHHVKECT